VDGKGIDGKCVMRLRQIRYFLALANTLDFTRAAEQCNVTQSALTKGVQWLEQELGGQADGRYSWQRAFAVWLVPSRGCRGLTFRLRQLDCRGA
jgi:hypothetical protein